MPNLNRPVLNGTFAAIGALVCATAVAAGAQTAPVVNNPAPNPDAPSFRVSAEPLFTVGGLNDDPRLEMIWGVSDADMTRNGKLLVAPNDGRTAPLEVRIFGSDGRFERSFGRRGEGPGEFRQITRVWQIAGDSIAVHDGSAGRVSVFDGSGKFGRTIPNVSTGRAVLRGNILEGRCCFDDWSFLHIGPANRTMPDRQVPRDTITWSIGRAGSAAPPQPILRLEAGDDVVRIGSGPGGRGNSGAVLPFSRSASVDITGSEIVFGIPDSYEYRVYSRTGALVRIVRADVAAVPVTSVLIAAARERFGIGAIDRSQFLAAFDRFSHPKTLPAYLELRTERDGTVWVRGYDGPAMTVQWWARFDSAGKLLGTIIIPENRNVLRFTGGYVLLQRRDPDEGNRVYVHRIEAG